MPGKIRRKINARKNEPVARSSVLFTALVLSILTWQSRNANDNNGNGQHSPSAALFGSVLVDGFSTSTGHTCLGVHRSADITLQMISSAQGARRQLGRRRRRTFNARHGTAILSNNSEVETKTDTVDDRHVIEILYSYAENLKRARRTKGDTKAANSLAHYLQNNVVDSATINPILLQVKFDNEDDSATNDSKDSEKLNLSIEDALERALIPALRQAGESNDYRMILRLISGSIAFANDKPILTPRIFGEALNALSQTNANAAKLKSVWNFMVGTSASGLPSFLATPPTAFELNVFLKSLASLGKSRACIDVYHQYCTKQPGNVYIRPDAYTISILFSVLADSISPDQKMCDPVDFTPILTDQFSEGIQYMEPYGMVQPTPVTLRSKMKSLTSSTCWQWNTAVELFDTLPEDDSWKKPKWRNNHVYSSLLKLQDKAQDLCNGQSASARRHKNGPELTMSILDDMMQNDVIPDVVTCTLAIKAMGRAAVSTSSVLPTTSMSTTTAFGDDINTNKNLAVQFLEQMKSNPKLPHPNQYSYSAVIKACSRVKDHRAALELLDEMRSYNSKKSTTRTDENATNDPIPPPPNTWVYNAALLSLNNKEYSNSLTSIKRWRNKQIKKVWAQKDQEMSQRKRTEIALSLVDQMKDDEKHHGLETKPDTITYNTVLGVGTFPHQSGTNKINTTTSTTISALSLIDEMKKEGIARDSITYCNAIDSTVDENELIDILRQCLDDSSLINSKPHNDRHNPMSSVFNTALYSLTAKNDFGKFKDVLTLMFEHEVEMNEETLTALIYAVGQHGKGASLEKLIEVMDDNGATMDSSTRQELLYSVGLLENDNILDKMPTLVDSQYTEAIKSCLRDNEFANAYNILSMMRAKGINPTTRCMEGFALAYAQSAMDAIEKEKNRKKTNEEKHLSACISRASNAYKIAMALTRPRPSTLGRVARACAITGQWNLCRALLRSIHENVLTPGENGGFFTISPLVLQTIRGTHSFLLRECAKQGNVHAALHYTSDIQEFSKKIRARNQVDNRDVAPAPRFAEIPSDEDDVFKNLRSITDSLSSKANAGMQPNDWISLIQAASKSGHWKVCFNTLQFLRPYVEKSNLAYGDNNGGDEKYNQLAQALYVVTRSLESHSQYAWATRGIEDWIEWSGRQPRVESVLSAIRSLASNDCVGEIRHLMATCLREDLTRSSNKSSSMTYEEVLYVGTVTALHNNGLYDDADEMFMTGIQEGFLPFDFVREKGQFVLDLHGLNVALAHSAVRIAMRQQAATLAEEGAPQSDMIIITGKGRNSEFHLRPVLRPEVQRMLLEEFYPPLNTMSVPRNMGALAILGGDIEAWQEQQQQQKGVRMLKLAGLLRNLSSQERLKQILAQKLRSDTTNNDGDTNNE